MTPAQKEKVEAASVEIATGREESRLDHAESLTSNPDLGETGLAALPKDNHTYRIHPGIKENSNRVQTIEEVHEALQRARLVSEVDGSKPTAFIRTNLLAHVKQEIAELDGRAFRVTHIINTDRLSPEMSSSIQRIWKVAQEAQECGRPEVVVRVVGSRPVIIDRVLGYLEEMNRELGDKAGNAGTNRNFLVGLREGDPLPSRSGVMKAHTRGEAEVNEPKRDLLELSSRGDMKSVLDELRGRLRNRHERLVENAMESIFHDPEDGPLNSAPVDNSPVQIRVKDLKAARVLAKLKPQLVKEFAVDEETFDREVLKVTYTRQVVADREAEKAARAQSAEKSEAPAAASGWGIGKLFAKLKFW
jgi:hypothetical protein